MDCGTAPEPIEDLTALNGLEWLAESNSRLSLRVLMTPEMVDVAGKVRTGVLLEYLGRIAHISATRYAGTDAVTLAVDRVDFLAPVHVGELATFQSAVNFTSRTSMEIGIRVTTQDGPEQGDGEQRVRHTNSAYITMVAIGADGLPTMVPGFRPGTTTERRRFRQAHNRQHERLRLARLRRDRIDWSAGSGQQGHQDGGVSAGR